MKNCAQVSTAEGNQIYALKQAGTWVISNNYAITILYIKSTDFPLTVSRTSVSPSGDIAPLDKAPPSFYAACSFMYVSRTLSPETEKQ